MGDGMRLGHAGVAGRAMQAGIVVVLCVGLYIRNLSVVVNAVFALGVTLLPRVLAREAGVRLDNWLTAWVTLAVLLHAVGMLGPYSTISWWDHVTHTLSATVVAGVGYATARAFDEYSDAVTFPPGFLFVFVLLLTLAFGVFWEVLEFGVRLAAEALGMEAVLVQYGLEDTLVDLVFDAVGALVVALFGTDVLAPTVSSLTAFFRRSRTR